ncbi:MAG: DUF3473 domain-containing protein [Ferruginibacter sp.]
MKIDNIAISVDMEDWFHGIISYNNSRLRQQDLENRFVFSTQNMLNFFSERKIKATFFVLGSLAEKAPGLIREIQSAGHEVASHGWSHQLVYNMTPSEFERDIDMAKKKLEDIVQEPVLGYRAPYFSITNRSLWAPSIIESVGYRYDSSISSFKNFIYGIKNTPRFYYFLSKNLLEIPPSCLNIAGFNIPWTGGLYFRVLPYFLIQNGIKKISKNGKGTMMYFHTADFDLNQPNAECSFLERFIHYAGLKSLPSKMDKLFTDFRVYPIQDVYSEILCR